MSATSFNPLAVARDLKATGIDTDQAEAIAEGMRQAAGADRDTLATKADLDSTAAAIRAELGAVEIRLVKWGIGLALGVAGLTAAVVLTGVRLMLATGAG